MNLTNKITAIQSTLRNVPRHAKTAHFQMATRHIVDAKMWMNKGNHIMASEKASQAAYHANLV